MFRLKKISINILFVIYVILFFIEFGIYLKTPSNIFGLFYLSIKLFTIFMFFTIVFNYKRRHSINRVSKIIIVILFGLFNSYVLQYIVLNNIYIDSSQIYINKIWIIKNILTTIIYFILTLFVIFEIKYFKKGKKI